MGVVTLCMYFEGGLDFDGAVNPSHGLIHPCPGNDDEAKHTMNQDMTACVFKYLAKVRIVLAMVDGRLTLHSRGESPFCGTPPRISTSESN